MADITALVTRLAEARADATRWRLEAAEAKRQWVDSQFAMLQWLAAAEQAESNAETALREAAVEAFKASGEKSPAPGVKVVERQTIAYEDAAALAWAKSTGLALKLDTKAFEKIARATGIPCVTLGTEPAASIATDLSPYLTPTKEPSNGQH